jgi:predicted O-methyltransferase YrrM
MDPARRALADELYATSREHDAAQADRLDRFRNVEADTAELLGRTELARANLAAVGLVDSVELRTEDAGATLAGSPEAVWEFVFLDAERPGYAGYLPDLVRTLAPRGVLAIDNVRSHAHELAEFSALIEREPGLTQTVVPVGAGLRLAVRDVI